MANQTKENVELTESSIFSIDMKENWYDSPKMRQLIMRTYAPSASPEEFMLFTQVCKERHLSPVDNEISFQKRWSRRKEKQKDGSFKVNLTLPAGNDFQFRYLINSEKWENDWSADKYMSSTFAGVDNSVIIV